MICAPHITELKLEVLRRLDSNFLRFFGSYWANDPDEFFAELEEIGEDEVRTRLATQRIYGSDKRPLVEEWLRQRESSRKEAFNREQAEIARDAAAATWEAARAAKSAADAARLALRRKIALVIVAILIIVSAIRIFS